MLMVHSLTSICSSFDNGFDLHGMHNITSSANFSLLQAAAEQDEADHKGTSHVTDI